MTDTNADDDQPNEFMVCRRGDLRTAWTHTNSNDRPHRHTTLEFPPLVTPYTQLHSQGVTWQTPTPTTISQMSSWCAGAET
jgi:hypothetical protein